MATWRDGTTTLNGLRFHFLDWGTAGRDPILLLHGGAQTAHSWDEVAPDLARDHHVLALDQRGHGDSDWAPGSGSCSWVSLSVERPRSPTRLATARTWRPSYWST